ncbi:hypothetical protein Q5P01_012006 [Channa striata]|uniref:Uncharacterized protein n=1 Tax=Channa striata TaxID=64152 RepID=A0AA88SJT3_CHASR|nr:hypothetical protein Q5P01_012006 [Channa striata]
MRQRIGTRVGPISSHDRLEFQRSVDRMGEVNDIKVPGKDASCSLIRLYLIAKSAVSASRIDSTALGSEAGASLGLVWVNCQEQLFDHLRNVLDSRYVYLGTESGNSLRCAGFCEWRHYDPLLFDRMGVIGRHGVQTIPRVDTGLTEGDNPLAVR